MRQRRPLDAKVPNPRAMPGRIKIKGCESADTRTQPEKEKIYQVLRDRICQEL